MTKQASIELVHDGTCLIVNKLFKPFNSFLLPMIVVC